MNLWKRKLAAWLHDPAEKALVLMRDVDNQGQRIGHEEGSVAELRRVLGITKADFDRDADRWAAAADRPQWPCEDGKPRPDWANVRFVERPVLIHPLSGEEIDLGKLDDVAAAHVRHASLDHFLDLVETDEAGRPDHLRTLFAFWRFGPELAAPDMKSLWRLLPADTRVPDHSIWVHLDMVSALAGAMVDGPPALLAMSFGPVQTFITQARSTSDLWAGSHLLSSLVWEGLKVICEALGPDAVLFPNLRGVAAVDRWLVESAPAHRREAWERRFEKIEVQWLGSSTDSNPLFAATLPNKFMAIVPARRAQELAEKVTAAVRAMALKWATEAAQRVFQAGGRDVGEQAHWRSQVAAQLCGFPEAHWSVAEWPTQIDEDGFPVTDSLEAALSAFSRDDAQAAGFFAEPMWKLIGGAEVEERAGRRRSYRKLVVEGGHEFFVPNPGLLYPAVHELAERTLATAKSLRPFGALPQSGWRCSLTGEHEWLADDPLLFLEPREVQAKKSVWSALAGRFGIKEGEHLGALATLKRLWPTMFVETVKGFLANDEVGRFVVSTHTMALASDLEELHEKLGAGDGLTHLVTDEDRAPALPRSLARLRGSLAARIPAALDRLRDSVLHEDEQRLQELDERLKELLGHQPETYYALIQMDGDRMGAWMAGSEPDYRLPFEKTWHEQVRVSVARKFGGEPEIAAYMKSPRPASPARHAAISGVLNDFSTHVARHLIEDVFKGKLLYAGGDDVLAMVSLDDLLPAMLLLRAAYSGVGDLSGVPGDVAMKGLQLGKGFVRLDGRLMPMMGSRATASMGAVVAHHQAPLSHVLRELRSAEKRAKEHKDHGRNAFCLRVMKRSGGEVGVTSRFWQMAGEPPPLVDTALGLLLRFAETLARPEMSRRAVYRTVEWLAGLPPRPAGDDAGWREMVATNLMFQLQKQGGLTHHARELVDLACCESRPADTVRTLDNLLVTAEFFAREGRAFGKRL